MELKSLNCPNCNGHLEEKDGKFTCTSCGAKFALDYDASDVAHEALKHQQEMQSRMIGGQATFFKVFFVIVLILVIIGFVFTAYMMIRSFRYF